MEKIFQIYQTETLVFEAWTFDTEDLSLIDAEDVLRIYRQKDKEMAIEIQQSFFSNHNLIIKVPDIHRGIDVIETTVSTLVKKGVQVVYLDRHMYGDVLDRKMSLLEGIRHLTEKVVVVIDNMASDEYPKKLLGFPKDNNHNLTDFVDRLNDNIRYIIIEEERVGVEE